MYGISWFVGILMSVTSFKRHCLLLMVILTQTFYQLVINFSCMINCCCIFIYCTLSV